MRVNPKEILKEGIRETVTDNCGRDASATSYDY